MCKKIIFYGGCQGINKSERLDDALNIICTEHEKTFEKIKLSDLFEEYIKKDKGTSYIKTLWYEDDWKKHETRVITDLIDKVKREDKINIINNHFSVPFMGKDNYVPGLDQHNLEKLLIEIFFKDSKGNKEKILLDKLNIQCFGLLLIEPEPTIINNYYKELYLSFDISKIEEKTKDKSSKEDDRYKKILEYLNTIMNYLSEEEIKKDLEQNRIWAKLYCDTANAVLGKEYVRYETIYITKKQMENGYSDINNKISDFLKKFI